MNLVRKLSRLSDIVNEYKPILPSTISVVAFKIALKFKFLANVPFTFTWKGLKFKGRPRDFYGSISDVFLEGDYDFLTPIFNSILSQPQPVIIDAGANIGAFALYTFSMHQNAIIHSIEPGADTFPLLQTNASMSKSSQWKVYQAAVWNEDGTVTFEMNPNVSSGNHISDTSGAAAKHTVKSVRLSSFVDKYIENDIDILKIDIEGAEEAVLIDSKHVLERAKHLVMEIHPDRCNEQNVLKMIREYFPFVHKSEGNQEDYPIVVASKVALTS